MFQILDIFWFREMGDLAFDPINWPDAREMITRLKRQGFREENHAILIPRPASRVAVGHIAQYQRETARRVDLLELSVTLEGEIPAVRRPEQSN